MDCLRSHALNPLFQPLLVPTPPLHLHHASLLYISPFLPSPETHKVNLNVARVTLVWVDSSVSTVSSTVSLWCLVDNNVVDP